MATAVTNNRLDALVSERKELKKTSFLK